MGTPLHSFRGLADGVDDARLRAAAANIALQELRDFGGVGIGITLEEPDAAHDHAWGAVSALKGAGIDERLLDGVQPAIFLQALDRGDWFTDGGAGGNLAGASRLAANQHRAGAALPFPAAVLAAGEPEFIAQDVEERSLRIVMNGVALAVYFHFDWVRHIGT